MPEFNYQQALEAIKNEVDKDLTIKILARKFDEIRDNTKAADRDKIRSHAGGILGIEGSYREKFVAHTTVVKATEDQKLVKARNPAKPPRMR